VSDLRRIPTLDRQLLYMCEYKLPALMNIPSNVARCGCNLDLAVCVHAKLTCRTTQGNKNESHLAKLNENHKHGIRVPAFLSSSLHGIIMSPYCCIESYFREK